MNHFDEQLSTFQKLCLNRSTFLTGLFLSIAYLVVAKLGLIFTVVADNVTLIWPPSGLALFALLVLGKRYWPWIMLGAFVTNLSTGISVYACVSIAIGNTLEAVTALYLLKRFGFDNRLSHTKDVLYLAIIAAGISTMVSASIGAVSLGVFQVIPWQTVPRAWTSWWMGDSMGVLAFTPLLLSWWFKYPKKITHSLIIEGLVLLVAVVIVTAFVFGIQTSFFGLKLPLSYMTFPFLIWAAMRFRLRGATTVTLMIGGIILLNIMFNHGPFAEGDTLQSLILLWLYTNFLAVTSMVLNAAIDERYAAEQGMRHMAEHDDLTHLPNRRSLIQCIEQAIKQYERYGEKFTLLFLDLDYFKVVNDSLGHSKGDKMLTIVSERLLNCVRNEDTVSRLGGDEFVILIKATKHNEDAYIVCNKIINSMRTPIVIDELELHSSVSMGVCVYPNDGDNAEILLKHADIAMYRAKDAGRDNYKFYSPEMNEQFEDRLSIENDLRHALNRKEFRLHYQPQYDMQDGSIKGCEALLRWYKNDDECIFPDIFIPILEETGKINEVGSWVIEEACRQLSKWNALGQNDLRMSVNVSSHQLKNADLPKVVSDAISRYKISPENLELEITESMLVRQEKTVEDIIQKLVSLGVRIAVDDFGTGYSSLSYLHRLSIDTLKVDRSFIENIPGNSNSEAIAKAIVGLAKSLQLMVVAEGIENNLQCEFMKQLGCDYAQGYLLCKPVIAEDFNKLLEDDVPHL